MLGLAWHSLKQLVAVAWRVQGGIGVPGRQDRQADAQNDRHGNHLRPRSEDDRGPREGKGSSRVRIQRPLRRAEGGGRASRLRPRWAPSVPALARSRMSSATSSRSTSPPARSASSAGHSPRLATMTPRAPTSSLCRALKASSRSAARSCIPSACTRSTSSTAAHRASWRCSQVPCPTARTGP